MDEQRIKIEKDIEQKNYILIYPLMIIFPTKQQILQAHYYLTELLKDITDLNKRSFASKYLHFHLPDLFYIYDSRAVTGMRSFVSSINRDLRKIVKDAECDNEYAKFFCKCFELNIRVEKQYDINMTNRQLDNLLVEIANDKSI